MSDDEASNAAPDPAATKASNRRRALFGGAAMALVLIGAGGVLYVTGSVSGNEAATATCAANAAITEAVGAHARGEVAAVAPVETPFNVSDLAFKDGDGKPVTLASFSGKTLLVNLWATWCVPCRAEMPALDALAKNEAGEDFAVVPINVDLGDGDEPKGFYAETGLTALPFFRDETMGVFNTMKGKGLAFGLPVSMIVDPAGCVRAAVNGPAEWASPDAVRLIDAVRAGGSGGDA